MTYDPQKAIRQALMIARRQAAANGGFYDVGMPNTGENFYQNMMTAFGVPPVEGASAVPQMPAAQPANPMSVNLMPATASMPPYTGGNMYQNLAGSFGQAPRTFQASDFPASPSMPQSTFNPATDPSRIINESMRRYKEGLDVGVPDAGGSIKYQGVYDSGGGDSSFGASAPSGAPGTGHFGRDVMDFGRAAAPGLAGAVAGGFLGGPIGAALGAMAGMGLADTFGKDLSDPASREDADQGAAQSAAENAAAAAENAAAAAAAADNVNSMSEAATADAAADSGEGDNDGGGGDGGGGDGGGGDGGGGGGGGDGGGEARGGRITRRGDTDHRDGQHEYEARCFASGGEIDPPEKTVKAYKLFQTKKNSPGQLFPLYVNADKPVPVGKWIAAEEGPIEEGKVKSSLGKLAYRPGWHAGDLPVATHIGRKSKEGLTKPDYRPDNHVWAEIEMPADVDWQSVANERADRNKSGDIIPRTAHITDQIPHGGFYRYKTNPNMTGNWLISGGMKVNRVLSNDEVKAINDQAGVADLPRLQELKASDRYADGGMVGGNPFLSNQVPIEGPNGPMYVSEGELDNRIQQAALGQGYADGGQIMPQRDLGADPAVQQALDITRQTQPTAPQLARQVQPQAMPTAESQAIPIAQPRRVFTGRSNLLQENGDHPGRISQRTPSSARGDDPIADNLMADTAASAASPQAHEHNIRLLASYPGMPENLRNAPTEEILQHFTNLAKGNLIFLHDLMPQQIRERAKLWYNGARNIAEKFSDRYDMPDSSAAGAMAALSPQKDWYMNVSLSERLLDILHNQHNLHYTREMEDRANKVVALPKFDQMLDRIRGKRLADITDPKDKALFVRLYDEAHHPRSHRIVTPEGEFGEMRTKQSGGGDDESGEDSSAVSWGSLTEIAKAIQAAESGGTKAELSPLMGQNHKVRNFHNNIVAPDAPHGDVTIDTHAVAAALLRPLSGSSAEVHHNFGSTPEAGKKPAGFVSPKSSGITGISGTYPIIADAYRQAANELGILPRELQSITWEGIRGIFSPVFKRNSNSVAAINDIWQKHGRGEIDINDARRQILEIAGGMDEPSWVRPSGRAAGRASDSSYERKLYPVRLLGEAPEVDGGIGGEPTGTFAGAEPISERDVAQLARARSLGRAIRNVSEMVPREGGLPASHGRISGNLGKRIVEEEAPDFGGNVAHVHVPDERAQSFLQEQGISSPNVYELRPGKKSGDMFHAAISDAKANNEYGAAVYLYDPQEYKDMRLFLTPDKKAGFALKGDDIVSVFNNKAGNHKNISHSLLHLAVKEGGRKLDAFDTVLPSIYAANGFETVSRRPFSDKFAPEGWDYDKFAPFNNGRPDVVYMAYNPKRTSFYQKGEGKYAADDDQAVKLQDGFVKRVNAGLQKLSSVKKDEPTRADGGSVVERALRLTAPYRPMVALADLFQRQLRGRPPS